LTPFGFLLGLKNDSPVHEEHMSTHAARTIIVVVGLLLLTLAGCSKNLQGNAGDKFSQPGLTSEGGRLSDGPGRAGDRRGGGRRPGEPGLPDEQVYSGAGEPIPSLSQFERPGTGDLNKRGGERRVGAEDVMASPSASPGGNQGGLLGADRSDLSQAAGLSDVFFGFNSVSISEEGREVLLHDANWMKRHPAKGLVIEGHCDERGTLAYNLVLGEKRARAIQKFLLDQQIDGRRLNVVSYGKEHPFCLDADERCYQQNRRGHLVVKN
jgi:peptidoglycan-associated lipoprotein